MEAASRSKLRQHGFGGHGMAEGTEGSVSDSLWFQLPGLECGC
jgi:hypothetical protein